MERKQRAELFRYNTKRFITGDSLFAWGLNIVIESPKGSMRHGENWIQKMANDYGYIRNTEGKDGDEVDVFIGPYLSSNKMYVIEQINYLGEFDEHKIMLGFNSIMEAQEAYHANYPIGWDGFKHIQELFVNDFKEWYAGTKTNNRQR